jgi:hypothetical protein
MNQQALQQAWDQDGDHATTCTSSTQTGFACGLWSAAQNKHLGDHIPLSDYIQFFQTACDRWSAGLSVSNSTSKSLGVFTCERFGVAVAATLQPTVDAIVASGAGTGGGTATLANDTEVKGINKTWDALPKSDRNDLCTNVQTSGAEGTAERVVVGTKGTFWDSDAKRVVTPWLIDVC